MCLGHYAAGVRWIVSWHTTGDRSPRENILSAFGLLAVIAIDPRSSGAGIYDMENNVCYITQLRM